MKKTITSFIILSLIILNLLLVLMPAVSAVGYISVTSPSSGTYYEGDTLYISWYSSDAGDNVKIELVRSGYSYVIDSNTSNNGYYTFYVSSGFSSNYQYRIRVTSLEDENIYDESSGFYIYSASITVTNPTSSSVWYAGESQTIRWDSSNAGNYVKIQYKTGSSYYTISSSATNNGYYNWNIPSSIGSGTYSIIITSLTNNDIYDYSDSFSIGAREIIITQPSGGETLYGGESFEIKWTSANAGNTVVIEYRTGSYGYFRKIEYHTQNDGSYTWEIPNSLSKADNYQIKISSSSYYTISDTSDFFSIDRRYITVKQPNGGELWLPNQTKSISWDVENAGNSFKITLYKNGVYCETIQQNANNVDSVTWTVSSMYSSDNDYQIEVRSNTFQTVYGLSSYFTIGERKITISSINEDTKKTKGDIIEIYWGGENIGDFVSISLVDQDQNIVDVASDIDASSGFYAWQIPSNTPSGEYHIRVNSNSYSDVSGISTGVLLVQDTFVQQISGPVFLGILFVIILIAVSIVVYLFRKKSIMKAKNNIKEEKTLINQPKSFTTTNISSEEYENIWEK